MAKSYVSPGVFTNEIDVSFLGPGVGSIGAAIIGTVARGPAFVPITLTTFSEFTNWFGDLDENKNNLLAYAARAYLKNAGTANIIRVLGPSGRTVNGTAVTPGYSAESMWAICANSGGFASVVALMEVTGNSGIVVTDLGNDLFFLSGAGTNPGIFGAGLTASLLTGSSNYIKKVLNTDPTQFSSKGYYVRDVYDYITKKFANGNAVFTSASVALTDFTVGYNSGSTPWIKSQDFSGQEYNLFKIHTLGHGEVENGRFKIAIQNIKPPVAPSVSEFGTFDVLVLGFNDDTVYEAFMAVTFDPKSPMYLPRAIGDRFLKYNPTLNKVIEVGNYENSSKFIRVEMTTAKIPDSSLPWGFVGLAHPVITSGSFTDIFPDMPYVTDLKDKATAASVAEADSGLYWGMETELSGNVKSRFTWLPSMSGQDPDFSLKFVSGSALENLVYNTSNPLASQKAPGDTVSHTALSPDLAKFMVPLAFGFDGFDRRISNPVANESMMASVSQLGTQAFRQAIDIISDPDFIDINLLAIPGVYSSKVVDYGIKKIEERSDALYIIDVTGSTVQTVVTEIKGRGLDTSYAACYYPSIRVNDDVNGGVKMIPASIPALGAIAFNDRVAYPWFAPAGLNRAGLSKDTIGFDVTSIGDDIGGAPNQADRDKLYENRVNPITRFPDVPQGVIWGQKTLQLKASALDRINVRRLLIRAKKLVASSTKYLVFEPGNASTMTRFKQLVNPILADIQQKQGLEAFKVVMDERTSPPELIDRNQLHGKIYLVPTRSAEIITVDFVISPSGATFEE